MSFVTNVKVAANGRLVLPKPAREAMGLTSEARLILTIEGDELRLSPVSHAVERAQKIYRDHAKIEISVDEFLQERKAEARRHNEANGSA